MTATRGYDAVLPALAIGAIGRHLGVFHVQGVVDVNHTTTTFALAVRLGNIYLS
jgi:hypothetical protein